MALTTCPECKREVSTEAASCPHCGYPMAPLEGARPAGAHQPPPVPEGSSVGHGIGIGFGVAIGLVATMLVLGVLCGGFCGGCGGNRGKRAPPPRKTAGKSKGSELFGGDQRGQDSLIEPDKALNPTGNRPAS
jgi:hypothetical protein